jgi:hypothetical protein
MKSREKEKKILQREMLYSKRPNKKLRRETSRSNKPKSKKKQRSIKMLLKKFKLLKMLQNKK